MTVLTHGAINMDLINLYSQNGSIIRKVDEKISTLSTNNTSAKHSKNMLHQKEPLVTLFDIHNEFVANPVNKASRSVAFICQLCLCSCTYKKFSLVQSKTIKNKTYVQINKTIKLPLILLHSGKILI